MASLLPALTSYDDLPGVPFDDWLPAVRFVADRHDIQFKAVERPRNASSPVFLLDGGPILKLVAPWQRIDFERETLALERVSGRLPVATPELIARGEIEDWSYLVVGRISGASIGEVWAEVPRGQRPALMATLGEALARLHAVETDGLDAIDVDWPRFLEERALRVVEEQRERGAPEPWLARIPAYLEARLPLCLCERTNVLLHADLHLEHVYLEQRYGRWRVSGVIDFGDARLGWGDYEFAAPGVWIVRDQPDLQLQLLRSYGYEEKYLGPELAARLTANTLLHEFFSLPRLLGLWATDPPGSLEEVEARLWAI